MPRSYSKLSKILQISAVTLSALNALIFIGLCFERDSLDRATEIGGLSCGGIAQVVHWSERKYGGSRVSVSSKDFGYRVGIAVAKMLDSKHLLFLQSEVDALASTTSEQWDRMLEGNRCARLEAHIEWLSAQAKRRLRVQFEASNIPSEFSGIPNEATQGRRKPEPFAVDTEQWKQRFTQHLETLATEASQELREAFRGNRRAYLASTLKPLFSEPKISPRQILMKAVLRAFDDYSTYLSEKEFADFATELAGSSTGIGVHVREVPTGYMVEETIDGAAAANSGEVEPGDIITAVDGVSLVGLEDEKVGELFKGTEGTEVTLSLLDGNTQKTREVILKRAAFQLEDGSLQSYTVSNTESQNSDSKIGIIQIPSFYGPGREDIGAGHSSSEDLEFVLQDLLNQDTNLSGVVLDLRGNPGGYLEEAVSMAGLFVGNEPVVAVVEPEGQRILSDAGRDRPLYDGPVVVLVDENSASASEVLAGALKDYSRAVLVGSSRTYGKGSVQKLFHLEMPFFLEANSGLLPKKGVVKLTTSTYYSPLGHTPNDGGVSTDIQLETKPAPSAPAKVEEASPKVFVDSNSLKQIQDRRQQFKQWLGQIEQNKAARGENASKQLVPILKEMLQSSSDSEIEVLAGAVAVAQDLSKLSNKSAE